MSADPYIGRSFGNYQLTKKIGEGGMGSVYLGEHPLIGKRVALKILHADLLAEDEMISRFFTEAKAVCQIGHQNIVDILDFGKDENGDTYFIMEYLEGQPLADAMEKQGALNHGRAVKIAVQTASALAASHALGIVHRDLKPENIYLTTRGGIEDFVKVLDFGIAKLTGDTGGSSHRTRAGVILGTPHYMSPEQCEGTGHIDHRADIYSLGIIIYEMVAGTVPFDGKEMAQIMVKHLTAVPTALDKVRPDCPPALAAITARCLKKDPNQRFPDMQALKEALQKILPGAMPDIREESGLIRVPDPAPSPNSAASPAASPASSASSHPSSDTVRDEEPKTMMLVPEETATPRDERSVKPISSSSQQNELKTMMLDGTSTDTAMPAPVATAQTPLAADSADIKTMMMDPGTAPTQIDDEEEPATNVIGDDDEDDEAVKTVMMDPDHRPPVQAGEGAGPGVPESGPDAKTFMLDPSTQSAPPMGTAPGPGGSGAAYVAPAPSGGGGALGALVGALVGLVILAGGGAAYYMGFIPDFLDLRIGAHADVDDDEDEGDDDDDDTGRDRDDDDDDDGKGGGGDDDDDDDDDKGDDDDDDDDKGDDDDDDDDDDDKGDDDDDGDKTGDDDDDDKKPTDGETTDAGAAKPADDGKEPADDGKKPVDDAKKPADDAKTVDDGKKPGDDGAPATAAPKKKKKKPGTATTTGTTGTAKKKKKKKPGDPGLLSPF